MVSLVLEKKNKYELRKQVVRNLYAMATIKWTPTKEFTEYTKGVLLKTRLPYSVYQVGSFYYGLPFTKLNKTSMNEFLSDCNGVKLTVPTDEKQVPGADCTSSLIFSMQKYVSIPVRHLTNDFLFKRDITTELGDISIGTKIIDTDKLIQNFTEEDMYESYSLLRIGDIVCSHFIKENGKMTDHTRIISGNTKVVRDKDGNIDGEKSYIIEIENTASLADMNDKNNYGGMLDDTDYIVPFTVNEKLTDIRKLSDFAGKNTNFRINRKISFKSLYVNHYFALTFNFYKNGELTNENR